MENACWFINEVMMTGDIINDDQKNLYKNITEMCNCDASDPGYICILRMTISTGQRRQLEKKENDKEEASTMQLQVNHITTLRYINGLILNSRMDYRTTNWCCVRSFHIMTFSKEITKTGWLVFESAIYNVVRLKIWGYLKDISLIFLKVQYD